MRSKTIAAFFLLAGTFTKSEAQENKAFASFARTKDSLMNIAYYDKDIPKYKKLFNEFIAGYNKLNAKDKNDFKNYLQSDYYEMACAYAKMGDKNNALDNLERSKYYDYNHLLKDKDLDNLRKEPRFIKFLNAAKNQKSSYQITLQKDAKYNASEKNDLPIFSYQSAKDPNLTVLKTTYNLDSVAGNGNDISRIINLMEWVHYLIPHDGSKGNPATKNAMSLITECKRDKKTLNCRGLAILLNEVYLSEGFKSRFVTCLPKDITDNDCHVITMVWSMSLKKWLWMDPTFMAYVMNEDGELLSIEEVRARLVNGQPLILNPDANRNHATSQAKSDYLGYYMSKNLYKLECPVSSEYNYETPGEGKTRAYIQLVPGTTAPKPKIQKDKHGVDIYSEYYTNNPRTFWAAPASGNGANGTSPGVALKANSGHSQTDYENAIGKFKSLYNQKSVDGINGLFTEPFWNEKINTEIFNDYGTMSSYKFLGMEADNEDEDVALFKVVLDRSVHCMAISLDENNKIATFRFQTTSGYIDWIMAKELDKERASK